MIKIWNNTTSITYPYIISDRLTLRRTIIGANLYASNRSFLEFINDNLQDFGISDASSIPYFKSAHRKKAVLEVLAMPDHLNTLQELAFEVEAHKAVLAQSEASQDGLSPDQLEYHRSFIARMGLRLQSIKLQP